MSMLVAALVFVPLLAVAIACFLWSLGRTWPLRNHELLACSVVGRPGVTRLPRLPALLVAVAALAAGIVALSLADRTSGGWGLNAVGLSLGGLFVARGVAGYTARWRSIFTAEPFATLDRRNYSPLALFIGAGFLLLVIMRLI